MEKLRKILLAMAALMVAGVLFVAGAWAGKKFTEKPAPVETEEVSPGASAKARAFVEAALSSRFNGNHREALRLLDEARRYDSNLRGLDYQFGLTQLDLADYPAAEASAKRSVARGEETGNAHALLALVALESARAAGNPAASEKAVLASVGNSREADPLNPAPHYVLAEFYRATGRPGLAVESYRKAFERASSSDSILVATIKVGLSGLRLDHSASSPPYEPQVVDGETPPEQLVFGAADAVLRGDKDKAVAYLKRARQRIPGPVFQALLKDPLFEDYLLGPEQNRTETEQNRIGDGAKPDL